MAKIDPHPVEQAAKSEPMGWLARIGLGARAAVYLIMGWLAILVAIGQRSAEVDQRGVVTTLVQGPAGRLLVIALVVGLIAYAVWRLSEAAFGVTGGEDGAGPRLKSLVRGLAYLVLAGGAVAVLLGSRQSQDAQQTKLAATTLQLPGGQWLLGLVGLVVIVVGVLMIYEGWTVKFLRYFDYLPPRLSGPIVTLGRVGSIARGIVFALAGALVVIGAVQEKPKKAGGINELVQTTLDLPFGPVLVALMGLGLIIFGVYAVAETIWRHVPSSGDSR